MKLKSFLTVVIVAGLSSFALADENHEIIEKVMKKGLKGKTSPLAKVIGGEASEEETKDLFELVKTLEGTKAAKGDQKAYDEKVGKLISDLEKVAGGDTGDKAIAALKKSSNCKACHKEHKPD